MAPDITNWLSQVIRFGLVGVCSTLVHVGTLILGVEWLDMATQVANVFAFIIALTVGFTLNRTITFASHAKRSVGEQYFRYFAVASVGFVLNSLALFIVEVGLGLSYVWALPAMVFVVPLVVFYLMRTFVFPSEASQ